MRPRALLSLFRRRSSRTGSDAAATTSTGADAARASGGMPRPGGTRTSAGATGAPVYPGDHTGRFVSEYSPELDGAPDPGEIVWTWVPYEEDHSRGKDRPVLLVGRDGPWLLGLMLSSVDHSRDTADAGGADRHRARWMDVGAGPWDSSGRESEVRLDRVLRIDAPSVRREGAIMDRGLFDAVVARVAG